MEVRMTLKEACEKLGLETLPEGYLETESKIPSYKDRLCSLGLIESLQKKYDLFDDHYEAVKEGWEDIQKDEAKKLIMDASSVWVLENPLSKTGAGKTPFPPSDKTPAGNMLPVFILLPAIESCYEEYIRRGFSPDKVYQMLRFLKGNMNIYRNGTAGVSGLSRGLYDWVLKYVKVTLFDYGGLNFEVKKSSPNLVLLRNKKSGELLYLAVAREVHKSGLALGSGGMTETEGSFLAEFEETDTAYIGHPVRNFRYCREKESFSKDEWEVALAPRTDVLGVHIPRKTNFAPEAVSAALEGAVELGKKGFPECEPKAFDCTSWLLDPALKAMMGENSKITAFAERFVRAPAKSSGKEVFSFVFNLPFGDFENLPENTSLERGLKAKYLAGEYIYGFTGVIMMD